MKRRRFLSQSLGSALLGASPGAAMQEPLRNSGQREDEPFIERGQLGQPHKGKTLAAIQPHCDDIPLYAAGTVLKLVKEGYRGILIRTSFDDAAGTGETRAEVTQNNERVNFEVARRLGMEKVFDLAYRNHYMDEASKVDIRGRLIFIFRLMKVDTVICYDPTHQYDANPDHFVTAEAVQGACWMAGGRLDYPEHLEAGLTPHTVNEKYYFARGPQLVNRIVDISSVFDQKVYVNLATTTQPEAGEAGAKIRAALAARKHRLPILGNDDETANREFIKQLTLWQDRELGRQYGLEYAEPFHYIGPGESVAGGPSGLNVQDYIKRNAVPL